MVSRAHVPLRLGIFFTYGLSSIASPLFCLICSERIRRSCQLLRSILLFQHLIKKVSILVFVVCFLIALRNHRALNELQSALDDPLVRRNLWEEPRFDGGEEKSLKYDFYTTSCPSAEKIIRSTFRELHRKNNAVGPQLLRLAFHDCFVGGCDASILLDSDGGIASEKREIPNLSLKGFEEIDVIKSRLEEKCPAVVSCADIVALAARESVLLAGGQFYPVFTGRKDSRTAFPENARREIPGPDFDVVKVLDFFAAKGFDARETVALLGGGHSTGKVHCDFFRKRLFNFTGTNKPDPSINPDFLEVLRAQCSHASSSSSLFENRAMQMDYEGPGKGFGEVYFRSLLRGKGLLFADQQLLKGRETKAWVETYVSDIPQFRRSFGLAMFKLTHLQPSDEGEVRLNCRRVNKAV